MPSKKQPPEPSLQLIVDEMRSHSIVLEDIRSQNRATIEAVEATRLALEHRIDRVERDSRGRDAVLEMAIRSVGAELRDLRSVVQENSLDTQGLRAGLQEQTVEIRGLRAGLQEHGVEIRTLVDKVEALVRIEERVTALEQRRD